MTEHDQAFAQAASVPQEEVAAEQWMLSVKLEMEDFFEREPKTREAMQSDPWGTPLEVLYLLLMERHEEALIWQVRQLGLLPWEWAALTQAARDMAASRREQERRQHG